jgi:Zinc finger, C3HC4 type (RING finger)
MEGQEGFITVGYAPADFADSEITRPSETYLDSGSQAPATIFSSAVTNTQATHFRDVRERHVNTATYAQSWKRKIRDLFHHGNEEVLGFLAKPLSAHPTLGRVEQLIRRYSKPDDERIRDKTILRDLVADLSGTNMNTMVEEVIGESLHTFVGKIHKVYELYREILDQTCQADIRLRNKLHALDKIQPRLVTLMELGSAENTAELERQIELYLKSIYDQNNPEEDYKASLQLFKKFLVVKELVGMLRLSAGADREPICGICLNDTVLYAVVPCGHTYCDPCSKKQYTQCFMCRQTIRDRIKIFFT